MVDFEIGCIIGSVCFLLSFGGGNFVLYFCIDFKGVDVLDSGIFVNSWGSIEVKNLIIFRLINGYLLFGGVFVRFSLGVELILVRIVNSFISVE